MYCMYDTLHCFDNYIVIDYHSYCHSCVCVMSITLTCESITHPGGMQLLHNSVAGCLWVLSTMYVCMNMCNMYTRNIMYIHAYAHISVITIELSYTDSAVCQCNPVCVYVRM